MLQTHSGPYGQLIHESDVCPVIETVKEIFYQETTGPMTSFPATRYPCPTGQGSLQDLLHLCTFRRKDTISLAQVDDPSTQKCRLVIRQKRGIVRGINWLSG